MQAEDTLGQRTQMFGIQISSFTVWLMYLYDRHIPHCIHHIGIYKGPGLQPQLRGCTTDTLICALAARLRNTITLRYILNYSEQNKQQLPFPEISTGGMCEINKPTKWWGGGGRGSQATAAELILGRGHINIHAWLFSEYNRKGVPSGNKGKRERRHFWLWKLQRVNEERNNWEWGGGASFDWFNPHFHFMACEGNCGLWKSCKKKLNYSHSVWSPRTQPGPPPPPQKKWQHPISGSHRRCADKEVSGRRGGSDLSVAPT